MSYTAAASAPGGPQIDIAVLASGSGTNLQALIDDSAIRPHIVAVLSDKAGVGALERATRAEIPTHVASWSDYETRTQFSSALADVVEETGAKGVVLAGFMRILSPAFIDRFPNRILNVHPSLLPAFPGAHAVEMAIAHGVKVTGVTVHVVDEEVDHGPIIAQQAVDVELSDSVESLHERIKTVEHEIYPRVVRAFVSETLQI